MKTFSKKPNEQNTSIIECPVCGGDRFRSRWSLDGYSFSACRKCGLLLQNPQPVSSELHERYDREYFEYEMQNEEAFLRLIILGLQDIDFFSNIESQYLGGKEKPVFLDVGCATGRLLQEMKSRGWTEKGVEVCIPAAEYARDQRGLDVFAGTLQEAQIEKSSVALAHASHLIEHLTDPADFIRQMHVLLRPGGMLVITTPNCAGFQALITGAGWRSAIADHMFLFSKRTISKLLENSGFRIEKTGTWGGLAAGMVPQVIKKRADRWAKTLGWGDVMIIRARKIS